MTSPNRPNDERLASQLEQARRLIKAAAEQARSDVQRGPDNPLINRIGSNGIAFTMAAKDLGKNWTPFFHDWKAQYELVGQLLEAERFGAVALIMQKGHHNPSGGTHDRQSFAPQVIEHLRSCLGDLPASLMEQTEANTVSCAAASRRAKRP